MLRHLHIQNYALISHLDIDFTDGFSVLTGETGAGKSIILGALALVMGARADSKAITDGEEKCIIEAVFNNPTPTLPSKEGEMIIRRELYANGKSRSFVDDSLVTLQELKSLANKLIDIHNGRFTTTYKALSIVACLLLQISEIYPLTKIKMLTRMIHIGL